MSVSAEVKGWGVCTGEMASALKITRTMGVVLRFSDWGNPTRSDGTIGHDEIPMSVRLDLPAIGFVYDGAADGLNGLDLSVPYVTSVGTTPAFDLQLLRRLAVPTGTTPGEFRNVAHITISGV